MAGIKILTDDFIAALKANAKDRDQLFLWLGTAAQRLAQRQQKMQERGTQDIQTFLAEKKTEFEAHRAEADAQRRADGEAEE